MFKCYLQLGSSLKLPTRSIEESEIFVSGLIKDINFRLNNDAHQKRQIIVTPVK